MTILLETDKAAAAALVGVLGATTVVVDSVSALNATLASDGGATDLVVVGPDIESQVAYSLATAQRIVRPALGVVLLRRRIQSTVLRDAMVAGVREVVSSDDLGSVAEACERSLALSEQVRRGSGETVAKAGSRGQLVTVFSAKGGCGKTTTATNLAVTLAGRGRKVCLLDLDLAFGDIAIALQLAPTRTISDAIGLSRLDESAVRSLVTPHASGVDAILAPVEPGVAERIPAALVADLLSVLKSSYDAVIVDCPPAFTDHVLAAFDQSDHFVLLTTLDIPALKNLKLTLETLSMLGYPSDRWHVALNRSDAKVGLTPSDIERVIRSPISAHVPSSRDVPVSINRGVPIMVDNPQHPVSRAVRDFALGRLASPTVGEPASRGLRALLGRGK